MIEDNKIRYRIKNDNEDGKENIWRYMHYDSHTTKEQKITTMKACLKKVHNLASDKEMLSYSGVNKLVEFARLQYPKKEMKRVCSQIARETRCSTWFRIRDYI